MRNSKVKGFTLVELIVVIAIIGILAAILVPSMLGYVRNARISSANSGAKQVHTACASALTQLGIANWKWSADAVAPEGYIKIDGGVTGNKVTFGVAEGSTGKLVGPSSDVLDLGSYLGDDFEDYGIAVFKTGTFAVTNAGYANTANGSEEIFKLTTSGIGADGKGTGKGFDGVLESTQKEHAKKGIIYGIYPAPKLTNS